MTTNSFPSNALLANPVFFRTYSRRVEGGRESWEQTIDRSIGGLAKVGRLDAAERSLVERSAKALACLPSGRWLWVGGTPWIERPENFSGAYNCTSTNVVDWRAFGLMMDLAMMGCGTGAVLERDYISQLPPVRRCLDVEVKGEIGAVEPRDRLETTRVEVESDRQICVTVGDSRQGWVKSYEALLELAASDRFADTIRVEIDVSNIRPVGEMLKGFGGVANPVKLPELYPRVARILNRAVGRQLTAEECCLLIDEAAATIVAGNIRRSAGIRQFDADFPLLKQNLWQPDEEGNWRIDPERNALRMANHTRVFTKKPTKEDCIDAVRNQFYSGEGAIQWAGEAIARANADLLPTPELKSRFLRAYQEERGREFLRSLKPAIAPEELEHRLARYGLNPCLSGDTEIVTRDAATGKIENFLIEVLAELVLNNLEGELQIHNGVDWIPLAEAKPRLTGRNEPAVAISLDSGETIEATLYHRFFLEDLSFRKAMDLAPGDRLARRSTRGTGALEAAIVTEVYDIANTLDEVFCMTVEKTGAFVLGNGVLSGNCGEIIGSNLKCDLSEVHLNQIDPENAFAQEEAFRAGALSVASLLHHEFAEPRYQYSRELDPIVGVSFTGLFDFFVKLMGVEWALWFQRGRPDSLEGKGFRKIERTYLAWWRSLVRETVWEYCDRHGLKRPNRYTCVQPAGTKSLLTNASPGWHPPKSTWYIRRVTFRKNDPVALACIDLGYRVVPSQSDKDERGNLLNDPFDPRCTEWLVEFPVAVPWADLPGARGFDPSQISALAQFDFYMQVQRYWTTHNTSATIEFREKEIEALGTRIHEAIRDDEGYISSALLARFDAYQSFPRLPFEPISEEQHDRLVEEIGRRRVESDFHAALSRHDAGMQLESGPAGCDSDRCLFPTNDRQQ